VQVTIKCADQRRDCDGRQPEQHGRPYVDPEQKTQLALPNLRALNGGLRKSELGKQLQERQDGGGHGNDTEILRRQHTGQEDLVRELRPEFPQL
jgi:hypothetical protein